jgi:hypothetical protein
MNSVLRVMEQEKVCCRCKAPKPVDAFNWKNRAKGIRQSFCRTCKKEYQGTWYKNHRDEQLARILARKTRIVKENQDRIWVYLKEHPCVGCPENDPVVLDFDHVRGAKRVEISTMLAHGCAWKSILKEIAKCEVRCRNCHHRRHAVELGSWRVTQASQDCAHSSTGRAGDS